MNAQNLTVMPVRTNSDLFPVYVMPTGQQPKIREGKFSPDGEQTYGTGAILLLADKDGNTRADKSASVHVIKPGTYNLGQPHVSRGRVFVQPYSSDNGRSALSITVEELVPVSQQTPASSTKDER